MKNSKSGLGARTRDGVAQNEPSLGRDIQSKIGQQLRAMYDDVVYWQMIFRQLAGPGGAMPASAPARSPARPERGSAL